MSAYIQYADTVGTVTRFQSDDCADETWSIMFSYYFTVVVGQDCLMLTLETLTTVGYGDIAPVTVLARLLVIVFIVADIILFSIEIENWLSIYRLNTIGKPPYSPEANTIHVVFMGNPSFVQVHAGCNVVIMQSSPMPVIRKT